MTTSKPVPRKDYGKLNTLQLKDTAYMQAGRTLLS